mmetsp:Transcript_11857/g.13787  ORF Transcript_11857/g.13787 Transcript_11857/m.13787 type:complete len:100 (+) Transcript_11857:955-1254(+)
MKKAVIRLLSIQKAVKVAALTSRYVKQPNCQHILVSWSKYPGGLWVIKSKLLKQFHPRLYDLKNRLLAALKTSRYESTTTLQNYSLKRVRVIGVDTVDD